MSDAGDPFRADGLEHPLDERSREAVERRQLEAGVLDYEGLLDSLPGSVGLRLEDLVEIQRLDFGEIDLDR